MSYQIFTDSCANLTDEMYDQLGVSVISFDFLVDNTYYKSYIKGRDNSLQKYFTMLREGKVIKTSCINSDTYEREFSVALEQGYDVLYLGFSSGLSTTYYNSVVAVEKLRKLYPQRTIATIDTLAASMGLGLLVYYAVQKQREGWTLEQVRNWVEENKLKLAHWFTVDDLKYLYRGGRVNRISFIIGKIAQIKPILHTDDQGHLTPITKVIGRKRSMNELVDRIVNSIDGEYQTIFICHGDCLDEAKQLQTMLEERINAKEYYINMIDPVIGCHSGPGTLAIFCIADKR